MRGWLHAMMNFLKKLLLLLFIYLIYLLYNLLCSSGFCVKWSIGYDVCTGIRLID
jgi:hypothetical protein